LLEWTGDVGAGKTGGFDRIELLRKPPSRQAIDIEQMIRTGNSSGRKGVGKSAEDNEPVMFAPINPINILAASWDTCRLPQAAAKKQLYDPRIGKNARRGVFHPGLALLKHQPIVGNLQRLFGVLFDQ
jgi:hypothetical protein